MFPIFRDQRAGAERETERERERERENNNCGRHREGSEEENGFLAYQTV